jgi:hypothetical protein
MGDRLVTVVLRPEDLRCPSSGKRAYLTEELALDVLERAWLRPQLSPPSASPFPVKVYRCPECGWWHLSSHHSRDEVET